MAEDRCTSPRAGWSTAKRIYGRPTAIGNGTAVGQGRRLPTVPVDQFAATLASWFGVAAGDLTTVLSDMGNYIPSSRNLGFL